MPDEETLSENGALCARGRAVQERIEQAAERVGRSVDDITLIAVSKTVAAERVREAYACGFRHFGENRVQELLAKQAELADLTDIVWHLIGQLQSNKAKDVVERADYIHSLDRLSLAAELQKQAEKRGIAELRCFVEINIAAEQSKAGVRPDELRHFVLDLERFPALSIVGLMTVAPICTVLEEVRPYFQTMAEKRDEIRELSLPWAPVQLLSMGMSGDYEVAIEEGASFVRVGTALFGARQ